MGRGRRFAAARRGGLGQLDRLRQLPAEIEPGEPGEFVVVGLMEEIGVAPRRPRLEVQRHRLVVDDLVAEPARGAPAYVESLHPVAFPTPKPEAQSTLVVPLLRLICGQKFL